MFRISLPADRAEPDMIAVARAFGTSITEVENAIHIGKISRWFELGGGDEDNKPHQIFNSTELGIRVNVDEHGAVHSISGRSALKVALRSHTSMSCNADRKTGQREDTSNSQVEDASDTVQKSRLDVLLDEALDESFPASDPVAINFESTQRDDVHLAKL